MKYRMLASLSVVAVLALGGGVAEAHNTTFQTSVAFQESYVVNGQTGVAGQVSSARAQCVPNRTVRVFAVFADDSRELVDIARTSDNGAFAGIGDFGNAVDALARVRRKNIGGSGHRHICGPASASFVTNGNQP